MRWPGQDRYEYMVYQQQKYRQDLEWARSILARDKVRQEEADQRARLAKDEDRRQHERNAEECRRVDEYNSNVLFEIYKEYQHFPTMSRHIDYGAPSRYESDQTSSANRILRQDPPPDPEPPNWTDWIEFIPIAIIVGLWLSVVAWGMVGGWQMAAEREGAWYDYVGCTAFGGAFFGLLALVPALVIGGLCSFDRR